MNNIQSFCSTIRCCTSINCSRLIDSSGSTTGITRHFHSSSNLSNNSHHKTRFEMMCELNKTLYIHRNAEFGVQPIFYRSGKKVDLWERHLAKLKKQKEWWTFSRQIDLQDEPVDNVYLTTSYKPKIYSIKEALETLKEYTCLDLTDQQSFVKLKLDLAEQTTGKGKRKRPVTFMKTTVLPYPLNISNKVCYFTENEKQIEDALNHGISDTGTLDPIAKILKGELSCNACFCSPSYFKELHLQVDLKKKLGVYFPNKLLGVTDDIDLMLRFVHETIIDNLSGDNRTCSINIGRIEQSTDELQANVAHMLQTVQNEGSEANDEGLIQSASVSCITEPLQIDTKPILLDDDDNV